MTKLCHPLNPTWPPVVKTCAKFSKFGKLKFRHRNGQQLFTSKKKILGTVL